MKTIPNYFEQVYAGDLGKVIGVYMGRPFEGKTRDAIEARWGVVDHFVHQDQNVPLVVADDDISGTFTFVRALEDSQLGADTPVDFFGDNWLNYLIERRTILWWGGVGYSTEHTAYSRLKRGIRAPESGSAALNGRVVSEQIGAQIFIDAFGLVAPDKPELAMSLAERAARVSHDGEAVIGAKVVAALVSMAFLDKDIHSLLDRAEALIPQDSLIAQVHRDVRAWARDDGDWRRTYDRIKAKYGYDKFGGGCHMIPNHALMVMAWEYAGNDFHKAQTIINTAGWDTDCNAANVGTVCALIAGLDGIDASYGFHSHPEFADRVLLPTADGTGSVTDCLRIARRLTRLGCAISGLPLPEKAASRAWHDFALQGALHGYIGRAPNASATYSPLSDGSARIAFTAYPARPAIVETPVSSFAISAGHYGITSTPSLYHGTELEAEVACDELGGEAEARLEVVCGRKPDDAEAPRFHSPAMRLAAGSGSLIRWTIDCDHKPISALRLVISSSSECHGVVRLARVSRGGGAEIAVSSATFDGLSPHEIPGWICTMGAIGKWGRFACDDGLGILVTGNRTWADASVSCTLNIHCAERAGILLDYQGLKRFHAVVLSHGRLKVIRNLYGETVLFDGPAETREDRDCRIEAKVADGVITVRIDGVEAALVRDDALRGGAAGLCVEEGCFSLVGDVRISVSKLILD
jgi:ADP-ribosylglycohydrolase